MKMKKLLLIACILATTMIVGTSRQFSLEDEEMYNNDVVLEIEPQKDWKKECGDVVYQMMDCLSYLSDSNETKPNPSCCKGLKAVLDVDFKCICFTLEYAPSMGIPINISRAEVMPSLCSVDTPPLTSCNSSNSSTPTAPAPEPSPVKPPVPVPTPAPLTPAPAPAPVKPTPSKPPTTPTPPPPSPAPPVSPSPPPPTSVTPPSAPPARPPRPAPPTTPAPIVAPPKASAAQARAPASGSMHIQMPFMVSSAALIVVSLFLVSS